MYDDLQLDPIRPPQGSWRRRGEAKMGWVASGIILVRRVNPKGDVMASLLTPRGKYRVIARGGERSRRSRNLDSFTHLALTLSPVQYGEFWDVSEASLEGALSSLSEPLRFSLAAVLCEFYDRVIQSGDEEGRWAERSFELLASGLRGIARSEDPEGVALAYLWRSLVHLGFPVLPGTIRGDERLQEYAHLAMDGGGTRILIEYLPRTGSRKSMWRLLRSHLQSVAGDLGSMTSLKSFLPGV